LKGLLSNEDDIMGGSSGIPSAPAEENEYDDANQSPPEQEQKIPESQTRLRGPTAQ
jgi:hypothetical protein